MSFHILSWIQRWENGFLVFQNSLALLICRMRNVINKNTLGSVILIDRHFRVDRNTFCETGCLKETDDIWEIIFLYNFSYSAGFLFLFFIDFLYLKLLTFDYYIDSKYHYFTDDHFLIPTHTNTQKHTYTNNQNLHVSMEIQIILCKMYISQSSFL